MPGSSKNRLIMKYFAVGLLAIAMGMLVNSSVHGQISPGELHQSHAFLEGVENCSKCHGSGRQLVPEKCLACHTIVRDEMQNHTGLHGVQQYKECQTCHVEHQGRTYDLVYWKDGQKNFDHALTGYHLEGKHASVECRACHTEKNIKDKTRLAVDKVTFRNTFLGLDTACGSCHFDEHRGQVATTCNSCHTTASWKPTVGFDHAKTKYPLTGRHVDVLCAKCHPSLPDNRPDGNQTFLKLVGITHDNCVSCHADVHKGKLGDNCQNCHSTEGWHVTSGAKFDHSKTRYPLEGKHVSVTCDKCHVPGAARKELHFAACRDCHSDFHKGAFAQRASGGACEECHTVAGYTPSKFPMVKHDSTSYSLKGAHLAVPCLACHTRAVDDTKAVSYRFRFLSTRCLACHTDPHRSEVNKFVEKSGCEFCHAVDSWKQVQFDHNLSDFHLDGKHAAVPCDKCHIARPNIETPAVLTFVNITKVCADCHKDIHRGQFALADSSGTDCAKCHTPQSWGAAKFDHNAASRFKLDGAHIRVPCVKCHLPKLVDGEPFVAYKPLDTTCAACHGATKVLDKEKKS
jgi:hypothetical protein